MRVIFDKTELSDAIDRVQRAAQAKITSNTNNGYFIAAENGKVELQANDYTIGIKTSCPAMIEEEGIIVIAASQLQSTIRMMPAGDIVMEKKKEENMVSFTCGSYFARFPTRDINDFPEVKEMEHTNHATVSCQDFKEMTGQVSFATASDKQKPLFTGVLFEVNQYRFIMAATNTHRLAAKEITLPEEASAQGRFVVSGSILSDVVRLLPDEEGSTVEISWSKNHVAFTFGSTYFITSLLNGEYPDYHRVIPTHHDALVTVNVHDFQEAVRFVSPISSGVDYHTINFIFHEDAVEIYEEDPAIGRSSTSIPIKLEGEPIKITYNCNYIEDILKHSEGETVLLHLQKNGPLLVEQEEDKAYQYVVTPMRGRH